MRFADFAAEKGGFSAKTHWTNIHRVGLLKNILFKSIKFTVGITVINSAKELFFGKFKAARAVAAYADANNTGAAPLTLSLVDRMKQTFADALKITRSASEAGNLVRQ